jgi:hypothetical protein
LYTGGSQAGHLHIPVKVITPKTMTNAAKGITKKAVSLLILENLVKKSI